MERLNQHAIKFLNHVIIIHVKNEPSNPKGSSAHIPYVDFSDKLSSGPAIWKDTNYDGTLEKIFKEIGGERFGFEDTIYPKFIKFTSYLSSLPIFSNHASEEFIIEETFN